MNQPVRWVHPKQTESTNGQKSLFNQPKKLSKKQKAKKKVMKTINELSDKDCIHCRTQGKDIVNWIKEN